MIRGRMLAFCVLLAAGGGSWSVGAIAENRVVCDIGTCKSLDISVKPGASGPAGATKFTSDEIWHYVQDILQIAGLAPNFELIETDKVANAAADVVDSKRVLYYNAPWVAGAAKNDRWRMYALLAHELGHHLQGHTLLKSGSVPSIELEADRYAGFVLAKMGATQEQATGLWTTVSETASQTHPGRADRIAKVTEGWKAGGGKSAAAVAAAVPPRPTDYVLPSSDKRLVTARDIAGFSPAQVRIARNEIFARYGYTFDSEDLRAYFAGKPWYKPRDKNVQLSEVEKRNVEFLQAQETASGGESVSAGFVFPLSATQALSRDQIRAISQNQRRIARNEIYARHGYIFADRELAIYFGTKKWYRPTARDVRLSEVEDYNVKLLRSLE